MAQERDAPPPGCRWMGDDLGCKDGRGHYRRAGDGEIIGTYPMARPKPKPAPRPQATATPTETPPSARDMAATPATEAGVPAAETSNPFALNDGGSAQPATEAQAPEAVAEPSAPPEPPAPAVAPAKPKPWWQAFWDWVVKDFMGLMKLLGLAK